VVKVDAPSTLALRSTTHLPAAWRERFGADIDWTWSFRLAELPGGRTRLQLRVHLTRDRAAPERAVSRGGPETPRTPETLAILRP
jgi:hypothetical protein